MPTAIPARRPPRIPFMGVVRVDELAALADGALPAWRRAEVEAAVAGSPELASLLRVQVETAQTIRAAAARVEAPASLHSLIQRRRTSGEGRIQRTGPALGCAVIIVMLALIVRRTR
jgi:anti-sigma factor RsiW